MTLKERRGQWERDLAIELVVVHEDKGYKTVYVLLSDMSVSISLLHRYHLHRYFKIGDGWECSCDKQSKPLHECLVEIDSGFKNLYPKEEG